MTNLEEILQAVQYTGSFTAAIDCLDNDFHNYLGDETVVYENCLLEDFCCDHENFSWACGASKVVLVADNDDDSYVLKTAYVGYAYEPKDENGNFIEDADWEFEAWDREDDCRIEYLVYRAAVARGVEHFFAETIKVDTAIYMQEAYQKPLGDMSFSEMFSLISMENRAKFKIEITDFDITAVDNVAFETGLVGLREKLGARTFILYFDRYTVSELQALQQFLLDYDINDLHRNNIGWFYDELKFVDYCGFGGKTSSIITSEVDN